MVDEQTLVVADTDSSLAPIHVANLPERIADRLIEAVARRQLLPGQRLIETDLSDQLSISRIPLREALRILESQGIVVSLPRRGVRLIAFDAIWAQQLYDVRVALERLASQVAAGRLRQDPVARRALDDAIDTLEHHAAAGEIFAINQADLGLHSTIYRLTESPLLQTLWSAIARHVLVMFSIETYRFQEPPRIVTEHHDLRRVLLHGSALDIDAEIARHVAGQGYLAGLATWPRPDATDRHPQRQEQTQ